MINLNYWKQVVKDSTPGKLENEPPETAYFFDCFLNGDGEYLDNDNLVFETTEEERKIFGLTNTYFHLFFTSTGFIYGYNINEKEYQEIKEATE